MYTMLPSSSNSSESQEISELYLIEEIRLDIKEHKMPATNQEPSIRSRASSSSDITTTETFSLRSSSTSSSNSTLYSDSDDYSSHEEIKEDTSTSAIHRGIDHIQEKAKWCQKITGHLTDLKSKIGKLENSQKGLKKQAHEIFKLYPNLSNLVSEGNSYQQIFQYPQNTEEAGNGLKEALNLDKYNIHIDELQQSKTRCKNELSDKKKELAMKTPIPLKKELGIPISRTDKLIPKELSQWTFMMGEADFFPNERGEFYQKLVEGKSPKPIRKLGEKELDTLREAEQERINQEVIPKIQETIEALETEGSKIDEDLQAFKAVIETKERAEEDQKLTIVDLAKSYQDNQQALSTLQSEKNDLNFIGNDPSAYAQTYLQQVDYLHDNIEDNISYWQDITSQLGDSHLEDCMKKWEKCFDKNSINEAIEKDTKDLLKQILDKKLRSCRLIGKSRVLNKSRQNFLEDAVNHIYDKDSQSGYNLNYVMQVFEAQGGNIRTIRNVLKDSPPLEKLKKSPKVSLKKCLCLHQKIKDTTNRIKKLVPSKKESTVSLKKLSK